MALKPSLISRVGAQLRVLGAISPPALTNRQVKVCFSLDRPHPSHAFHHTHTHSTEPRCHAALQPAPASTRTRVPAWRTFLMARSCWWEGLGCVESQRTSYRQSETRAPRTSPVSATTLGESCQGSGCGLVTWIMNWLISLLIYMPFSNMTLSMLYPKCVMTFSPIL